MEKLIWDVQGFVDDESLDWKKDFRLWLIHNDTFGDREIICTPFEKLREMGVLENREEMEKRFKNTTGISTSVLKDFQFTSRSFNGFSHEDGIENIGILIYQTLFFPLTCDLRFYIISHPYHFYCSNHIHFQIALRRY